ncbi:hypothetical protein AB0K15_43000 [Amycolatopsis sp. NPDC049253]|uniref:hypothetical protein n=1 Tax=Amycolatopsis sp. NPDC049253 TaxID=3155274 RepID=UPI003426F135
MVTVIDECRSMICTAFMSAPAASAKLAAVWRGSCSRIGGNPSPTGELLEPGSHVRRGATDDVLSDHADDRERGIIDTSDDRASQVRETAGEGMTLLVPAATSKARATSPTAAPRPEVSWMLPPKPRRGP